MLNSILELHNLKKVLFIERKHMERRGGLSSEEELKYKILEETVGELFIVPNFGVFRFPSQQIRKIFLALYHEDVFLDTEVKERLHRRLVTLGREMYNSVLCGQDPYDLSCPELLGYIMRHSLSKEEIALIKFVHGESESHYLRLAGGFLENVFNEIIRPIIKSAKDLPAHMFSELAEEEDGLFGISITLEKVPSEVSNA